MDTFCLNFVFNYQPIPEHILNCSKQFTLEREYDLKWKNRIYFTNNSIKVVNCKHFKYCWIKCKEIWWKEGVLHRDDVDSETGLTLPAIIYLNGSKEWYKEGKIHRDDKDPETGLTLPAVISEYGIKIWYKNGIKLK